MDLRAALSCLKTGRGAPFKGDRPGQLGGSDNFKMGRLKSAHCLPKTRSVVDRTGVADSIRRIRNRVFSPELLLIGIEFGKRAWISSIERAS